MGKSQEQNQNFSMDIDNSHSESGIWSWDGMSYSKSSSAMLDACHNHLRQERQRMVIGSPPPKPTPLIADVDDSAHYGDSIFRIHVPTADGENNNCGTGATSNNELAIGESSSEKIPGVPLENYVIRRNRDGAEDVVLPARLQGLNLREGSCQQPIIVYEEIDASDESDACATIPDEGGVLSLAVPVATVDVHEEKKRPPLPDMDVSC